MLSEIYLAQLFATLASAHLFLSSPAPIQGTAPKDPLEASGSNWPCHGVSLPSSGGQTFAAGQSFELAWDTGHGMNTAVHGGGSCQLALSYETDPSKLKDPANWHVIYSIVGGCPSNTGGNLGQSEECTSDNQPNCVNVFNISMPRGVQNGHAILSWTWYNTVGNREIYQNCVNANIAGGDGSEMNEFPSMFLGNLAVPKGECPTTQYVNIEFPNPGKYVTTKTLSGDAVNQITLGGGLSKTYPFAIPTGSGCAGDGGSASGGAASRSSGAGASSTTAGASITAPGSVAAPSSVAPVNTQSATPASQPSGGAEANPAGGRPAAQAQASSPNANLPAAMPTSVSAGSSNPTSTTGPSKGLSNGSSDPAAGAGSSNGSSSGAVSCSQPGSIVCISQSQFGVCDVNKMAVPQALAPGTTCSNGVIEKREDIRRHVAKHIAGRLLY